MWSHLFRTLTVAALALVTGACGITTGSFLSVVACADRSLAPEVVRIPDEPDDTFEPPRLLESARPNYTSRAMRDKVQGTVYLEAVVSEDGSVRDVCVVRALYPDLDAEAVVAGGKFLFEPGTRDGQPVPVLVTIDIEFSLR